MPVTTCTRNAVNVAHPSVCPQVSRSGTSRSNTTLFTAWRPSRWSSHCRSLFTESASGLPIDPVQAAAFAFRLQPVERARRRPAHDGAGPGIELAEVAGALEDP